MKPTFADLLGRLAEVVESEIVPGADRPTRSQLYAAIGILRRASGAGSRELACVVADNADMVATVHAIARALPADDRPVLDEIAARAEQSAWGAGDPFVVNIELQELVVESTGALRGLVGSAHDHEAYVLLRAHLVRSLDRYLELEPPSLKLVRDQ